MLHCISMHWFEKRVMENASWNPHRQKNTCPTKPLLLPRPFFLALFHWTTSSCSAMEDVFDWDRCFWNVRLIFYSRDGREKTNIAVWSGLSAEFTLLAFSPNLKYVTEAKLVNVSTGQCTPAKINHNFSLRMPLR